MKTSAEIAKNLKLLIPADVINFSENFFLKKIGIGEMHLWFKFGKDSLHTLRDIAILRFMTS